MLDDRAGAELGEIEGGSGADSAATSEAATAVTEATTAEADADAQAASEMSGGARTDDRDPEDRELVAALTAVLARKPRRQTTTSVTPAGATDDEPDDATAVVPLSDRRAFVSALRHQPSVTPDLLDAAADQPEPVDGGEAGGRDTAAWIAAARRRHLREAMHRAGAWLATIAIGTAIVVVAAIALFDGPRDLRAWLDLASRTF